MEEKHFFYKIQSDFLLSYLFTFFNLSDLRTLFPISKKFLYILNKDNKKIIRETQEKIFGSESSNELILKEFKKNKYNISNYIINKSPIINSILADNYLISSYNKFDNGFIIYDLNIKKMSQKVIFNEINPNYYIFSLLYIKEAKILLIGTNNGYIIGYYLHKTIFTKFWEYKTGFNKEIKKIIYYCVDDKFVILSLDCDDSVSINFIRIFYIENSNYNEIKYNINYIKSYIIKNIVVYNIKYFEGNEDSNKFFALCYNDNLSLEDINNNLSSNFTFDKITDNYISIFTHNKININFNNIKNNNDFILNNDTYEELLFDYTLIGHKSHICDYLYLKNNNLIISVEYLSPFLFIWDINKKIKINMVLLPHTDSILCLLNISNRYISTCGRDRKIYIYSITDMLSSNDNNKIINNFEIKSNHSSDIYKINYYKDNLGNNKIISSSFDKTIKIFHINNDFNKVLKKIILTGHSSSVCCVKLDLIRKHVITIDIDSVINIWEYNKENNIYSIRKSIELNIVNKKKEYIDDIILLFDNLNSIIKIDKTKKIKVFSLSREEFLYEYTEKNDKILKIIDCCNFNNFICYSSNNIIKIYIYKIQKINNLNSDYKIKNIKDINIDNINFKEAKMTCFELLTWKYRLLGIGYNNGKIVIMKINNNSHNKNFNITANQYLIDINSSLNNNFSKKIINQIKIIEHSNNSDSNIDDKESILYLVFSLNNTFFIYSINPNDLINIIFLKRIEYKSDIVFFEILNRNLIVFSIMNSYGLEFINLPKYNKNGNKNDNSNINDEVLINTIQISDEFFNKIVYTKNKKGIFCISNMSIKYLEFEN